MKYFFELSLKLIARYLRIILISLISGFFNILGVKDQKYYLF